MNHRTGLCVPKDGSYLANWCTDVGGGRYRFTGDLDKGMPREIAQAYVSHGLKLILTYDSDTFTGRTDEQAVQGLAKRYGGLIDIVENGNEPDGAGAESSKMPHSRINRLMEISRYYWGDNQKLSCPGLISGDESWLNLYDFTHCNLVSIHPYGQWAPGAYRGEGVFFGYLPDILKRYSEKAKALAGRFIPLIITEIGMSTWYGMSEAAQAHYTGSTVSYLLSRTDVLECHCVFAFHNHDGFGLLHEDGSRKPSCWAYQSATLCNWVPDSTAIQQNLAAQQGLATAPSVWTPRPGQKHGIVR